MRQGERENYDALLLGVSPAAARTAQALSQAGQEVALVGLAQAQGPSFDPQQTAAQVLMTGGHLAHLIHRAADFGVGSGNPQINFSRMARRAGETRNELRAVRQKNLSRRPKVPLIPGQASFETRDRIIIYLPDGTVRRVSAPTVIIAPGGRPAEPDVVGWRNVDALHPQSTFSFRELPSHIIVVGGGYAGVELSQAFRHLGSRVTLLQRNSSLLPREDSDVSSTITDILQGEDVDVRLGTLAVSVDRDNDGVRLNVRTDIERGVVTGSHVLFAVGRRPNTDRLNLHAAGIALGDRGCVRVDERLQTNVRGIYAAGEVTGGPHLAHVAEDDFRLLQEHLIQNQEISTQGRVIPYTLRTNPPLGRLGITERQARQAGQNIRVAHLPMARVPHAIELGETRGFMKAIVDGQTHRLLGATVLGAGAAELIAVLQTAAVTQTPCHVLRNCLFAQPGLAQAFNELFEDFATPPAAEVPASP